MNGTRWTPEEEDVFAAMFAGGADWSEIATRVPTRNWKAVKCKWERAKRKAQQGAQAPISKSSDAPSASEAPVREIEVDGDRGRVTVTGLKEEVRDLEDAVRVCRIDTHRWAITGYRQKAYQGFYKDAASEAHTVQLFSVSVSLAAKKIQCEFRAELDAMLSELRSASAPAPALRVVPKNTGRMLELSIPDAHLGKLAWWRECGQSYDVEIARTLFMAAVDDLVGKVAGFGPFDQIALIVGNDFLNADNFENTTARGTPQSTDGRQAKTFWVARRLIVDVVKDHLKPLASSVRVVMVAGNHDLNANFYLGEVLDAYFDADPDVIVDNAPTQRKYLEWGQVLLGWTHGSEERHASLPLIMAQEEKAAWGRTSYREWHLGHLHKKKAVSWQGVNEELGVTVRILPSLCAVEDWHTSKGYVGNVRSAEAYVWDKASGLVGTAVYNVPGHADRESLKLAMAA